MVNEFVLDDLSSSWTDSIYKNKSNSQAVMEMAPGKYIMYIYIKVALDIYIHIYI